MHILSLPAAAVALSILVLTAHAQSCVSPSSLPGVSAGLAQAEVVNTLFPPLIPPFLAQETSVQQRWILVNAFVYYNTLAAYHPTALDIWAREDVSAARRFCQPATNESVQAFAIHQKAALAYAILFTTINSQPQDVSIVEPFFVANGLNSTICSLPSNCEDTSTPWGIAYQASLDALKWRKLDGWNEKGDYKKTFNLRPFSDWRDEPYTPVNAPWDVEDITRWTPLLEDNGAGAMFHQAHVTPHVGHTGKSLFLGDQALCARKLENPKYDLEEELKRAVYRSATLDSEKMATIEFYDNKLVSLFPLLGQYLARRGVNADTFEFWKWDVAMLSANYEGILALWAEKTSHDLVRPTTVAEALGKGKRATAYAGTGAGIQEIPVDEWEPYIRTMPHAEFPSASSCLCELFAEVLSEHSNGDDFTALIAGPLVAQTPAGSSRVNPGFPLENVTFAYTKWSQISEACGESRLDGGMHFRAAVPAGRELCKGIGKKTVAAMMDLAEGKRPAYVASLDSELPSQDRCGYRKVKKDC